MKVGILTWFFAYNYGARAHSYASMKVINKMGYEVELIDFRPDNNWRVQLCVNLDFDHRILHPIGIIKSLKKCLRFEKHLKIYSISQRIKTVEEIEKIGYDVIVIGSDEVLNYVHPLSNPLYFGVGIKNTPHIFYAPSSGQADPNKQLLHEYKIGLNSFSAYSARDYHTKEFLENNIQKSVEVVLDPTLLYDFNDIVDKSWDERDYILLYSFDSLVEYAFRIKEYAKKHNLKIVCIGRESKIADISYPSASFETWIESFRHAKLIVTDSFHGTVFSLKNNKPFIICSRLDKVNKIADLMELLDIKIQFYDVDKSFEEYLNTGVDYVKVNSVIQKKACASVDYLKNTLRNFE